MPRTIVNSKKFIVRDFVGDKFGEKQRKLERNPPNS